GGGVGGGGGARAAGVGVPLPPVGRRELVFYGFGPVGGLFSFWWFVSAAVGATLVALAVLIAFPGRARRAAERVRVAALPLMFAAGIATLLLGLALNVLLCVGFLLLSIFPLLYL